jgi:hypothetical protein
MTGVRAGFALVDAMSERLLRQIGPCIQIRQIWASQAKFLRPNFQKWICQKPTGGNLRFPASACCECADCIGA